MKKTNSSKIKSHRIQQLLHAAFFVAIICFFQLQISLAQVPGMFNYQAVARDAGGNVMANQTIGIRISVLDGGPTGTASYAETHSITTNQFGLFTIPIGGGTASTGTLTGVNWVGGSEWLKVEMDPTGGTAYQDMSITQLLSVPYAIVSGKANNMNLDDLADVDCSTAQVGQVLKFNGTNWVPGNDNTGTGSSGGGNYIAGSGISISSNNVITNTGDINPYDDITNTTTAGGDLNGTYPNPQVDGLQGKPVSPTAPTAGQVLKFDGVQWGPGTDNASSGGGTTYSAGTGISITGDVISATAGTLAGDVTGTSSANTVSKIQNVTVLNTPPASGQVLKFNGTAWAPGADNGGSGGSYTAGTGISISGTNVISASGMGGDVTGTLNSNVVTRIQTFNVSANTPGVGDVMKWNGTAWAPGTDNTSGSGSGSSLWSQSGANIYNFNGGNVGVGNSNPTALFDAGGSSSLTTTVGKFTNANAANTNNVVSISNNGTGYNLYSYKNGQGEAAYFIKDNPNSGTADVYATSNGSGNTVDAFATGTGYAAGFHGGATAQGGLYANVTGSGYAGYFDGAISGGGIYAGVTGAGNAATLSGKVKIQYTCTNTSTPHLTVYEGSASNYARINFQNGSGNNFWSTSGMPNAATANALFGISYSPTGNIMTFTGDGNVGVGINAPTARFHVYSDANYTGSLAQLEINNQNNSNDLCTINSVGSGTLITGRKSSVGYGIDIQKTGGMSSTAAIYGGTGGQGGEAIHGTAFGKGGTGVSGNAISGNTTSTNFGVYGYAANSGTNYSVYGQQGPAYTDWAGYFNGNLGYTGTLIGPSDIKLKTDVQPFSGALNSVMSLKPMTYKFRHDGDYQYMRLPETDQIGLIAQDLEQVFPDLVKATTFTYQERARDANGKEIEGNVTTKQIDYKGVNYIGLVPVLVSAIQEQQKEIEDLKLQLSRLKQ